MIKYYKDANQLRVHDYEAVSSLKNQYHKSRYLEVLSFSRLKKRLTGLILDLIEISRSGNPILHIKNGKSAIAFVEVLEEYNIRDKDINSDIADIFKKFPCSIKPNDISEIINKLEKLRGRKCLFKFTPEKYVSNILEGKVRFCSASSYNKQGYNIAIKDDEINIESNIKNLLMTDEEGNPLPSIDDKITTHSTADYHVSCFSLNFYFKLFALFQSNSCVVITNGDKFCNAVKKKYLKNKPKCRFWANQVEYIDTCRQFKSELPMQMSKSSDYSYQEEYRFVGFPKYKHVDIEPELIIEVDPSNFEYHVLQLHN